MPLPTKQSSMITPSYLPSPELYIPNICITRLKVKLLGKKGFMKDKLIFQVTKFLAMGRSSSSVRRRPHAAKITGSNPVRPTNLFFVSMESVFNSFVSVT